MTQQGKQTDIQVVVAGEGQWPFGFETTSGDDVRAEMGGRDGSCRQGEG